MAEKVKIVPHTEKLPTLYDCKVVPAGFTKIKSDKFDTRDSNSYAAGFSASVTYNFEKKIARFSMIHKDYLPFDLQLQDVAYDFLKYKVPIDQVECTQNFFGKVFNFSIEDIKRHVLYPQFSCSIIIKLKSYETTFMARFLIDIPFFQSKTIIEPESFDHYSIPKEIKNIFKLNFKDDGTLSEKERDLLTKINYKSLINEDKLRYALCIEELTSQKELEAYRLFDVQVKEVPWADEPTFRFRIKKDKIPPNVKEITVIFIPTTITMEMIVNRDGLKPIRSEVEDVIKNEDGVWIECCKFPVNKTLDPSTKYTVQFIPNDVTFQACCKALTSINEKMLEEYFKGFEKAPRLNNTFGKAKEFFEDSSFIWCNKNIESNDEQKMAIKNIVNGTAFPYPYCVFGPPGTGKTSCLVECILQIMKLKPQSKILVTAQSNSACNEIGDRLLKFTSIRNVFRLYSSKLHKSNPDALSDELLPSSNLRTFNKSEKKCKPKISIFPTMEELKSFRVLICTLTASSQLDRVYLHNHFDYIFIDECAATTEPETYIPIVELGCDKSKVVANIVLIGDPKQLPPVVSAEKAMHLGLNVSLMERIMKTDRYLPNPSYDSKYITLLLDNYRSHHSILQFSNEEIYGSKLRARNKSEEVFIGTKWHKLPNKKFPVLFHNETTASMMDKKSSCNDGQINVVVNYVNEFLKDGIGNKKIKPEDIGIVTPYRAQSDKLKALLPENVEVGTSEYYQGREKLIIIFSTVRSKCGIGFVKDERRLNVCLTRAKALLIVIGNANTLKKSKLWSRFIDYCEENNGYHDPKLFKKRKPKQISDVVDSFANLKLVPSEADLKSIPPINESTKSNTKKVQRNKYIKKDNRMRGSSKGPAKSTDRET